MPKRIRPVRYPLRARRAAGQRWLEYSILHYLTDCYASREIATTSELAAWIERNRSTLSRRSSKVLGRGLLRAMRDFQLKEAARLLRTTNLTIIEIAERSGFGRVESTFYRAFRDAFGMTPTEFRKAKK